MNTDSATLFPVGTRVRMPDRYGDGFRTGTVVRRTGWGGQSVSARHAQVDWDGDNHPPQWHLFGDLTPIGAYTAARINADGPEDLWEVMSGSIDGADPQADNDARASFGARALATHAGLTGNGGEPLATALSDLLGDLRHLADALGVDYDDADATADMHYCAEIHGEF
jgi:hypothetical protein